MIEQARDGVNLEKRTPTRHLSHEMNNSLNTITLGLHVLAQHEDADIRFVVGELQSEVSDLQAIIAQLLSTPAANS